MGEGRPKGGHALAILPGLTHYNLGDVAAVRGGHAVVPRHAGRPASRGAAPPMLDRNVATEVEAFVNLGREHPLNTRVLSACSPHTRR